MSLDLALLRAETPGCAHVLHLNAAGSSLPSQRTLDATLDHLKLEATIGGYEAADRMRSELEGFYPSVARLIGAEAGEIAFVENATRAWDLAFYSLDFKPGDKILTCVSEYSSNYISYLQVARKTGAELVVVPDDNHGQIDLAALERAIDKRTRLISISHIPTQGGLVNPAAAIGMVARDAGVPYLLDACQAVGQVPVDVDTLGCDFLSATGRKYLRAPRGTGFLYVRGSRWAGLEPPFLDVHAAQWGPGDQVVMRADARRFESWEHSVANRLGLGVAVDYALALGVDAIAARVFALAGSLRDQLARVPGLTLHDLGQEQCGIVTFTIDGVDVYELAARLRAQGINISVSTIDFARYDFEARGLEAVARASVHYYNTEDELTRLVESLRP